MNVLQRVERWLSRLERGVLVLTLLALVGLSSYQILLRNLSLLTPVWISPLLHQLVLWVGLIGGVLAVRARGHIRLDLVSHLLSPDVRRWVERALSLVSVGVCLLLAKAGWAFVEGERQTRITELAGVPAWIYATIIPVAFVLMAVHFGLDVCRVRDAAPPDQPTCPPAG